MFPPIAALSHVTFHQEFSADAQREIIETLARLHPNATLPTVTVNNRRYWSFHMLRDVEFTAFQDLYNAALLAEYPDTDGYVWKTPEHGALDANRLTSRIELPTDEAVALVFCFLLATELVSSISPKKRFGRLIRVTSRPPL